MQQMSATAPSHWASFLINGDDSSLDASEREAALAFVDWLGGWPVTCSDAGFIWHHDAARFGIGGADCHEYVALI